MASFISIGSILTLAIEGFVALKKLNTTKSVAKASNALSLSVSSLLVESKQRIDKEKEADLSSIVDLTQNAPPVNEATNISSTAPTTMPQYLAQQNELATAQIEKTNSLISQMKHQSDILAKSVETRIELNANIKTISDVLSASLPLMGVQLQEVGKIASVISVKTEIETAYKEIALTNHAELIQAIENISLKAPAVNVVNSVATPSVTVEAPVISVTNTVDTPSVTVTNDVTVPSVTVTNDVAVPSVTVQADTTAVEALTTATTELKDATTSQQQALVEQLESMNLTAFYEDGVLNITNVAPAITVQTDKKAFRSLENATNAQTNELSDIKDYLGIVAQNAVKQKEIADYNTTVRDILNLDGEVVANVKPMELVAIKNAVNARNETDEMEFELPDSILDEMFKPITLPTFTKVDEATRYDIPNARAGI